MTTRSKRPSPSTEEGKKLAAHRKQIQAIDERLMQLVGERLQLAKEIGKLKAKAQLPIKDYRVEKEVLKTNSERAKAHGVYVDLAHDLTRTLIKYSVLAQDQDRHARTSKARTSAATVLIVGGMGQMGQWLSQYFETMGYQIKIADNSGPKSSSNGKIGRTTGELVDDLIEAAHEANIIVLATPISATAKILSKLRMAEVRGLIFDICSLKSPLIREIRKCEDAGMLITSIHPMFGPRVELLSGRNILICQGRSKKAALLASDIFKDTSAQLTIVPLKEHDRYMAYILGLSHFTNLVFARSLSQSGIRLAKLSELSSTTFQRQLSVTEPVIHENPDLYYEIQAQNDFSPKVLESFLKAASAYKDCIVIGNRDRFKLLMTNSGRYFKK